MQPALPLGVAMPDIVKELRQGSLSNDDYRWKAAHQIEKMRAALKSISLMRVTPDAEMDRFTLAVAIGLARDALGGEQ